MATVTALLIDLTIIAIAAIFIWFAARRGFVRTLLEFVGMILASVIAFTASGSLSEAIYKDAIRTNMIQSVDNKIAEGGGKTTDSAVDGLWNDLPSFVTGAAQMGGLTKDGVKNRVKTVINSSAGRIGTFIADDIFKPIICGLMQFFTALIMFTLLMVLVKFLAKRINRLFNVPVLGMINSLLGGTVGLAKGCLVIFIAVMLISMIMPAFQNKFLFFTPEVIDKTHLFKVLYTLSPFVKA